MSALIQEAWRVHGRIGTNFHVGDLFWQLRYPDFEQDLWLWKTADGQLAVFAMLSAEEMLLAMQLHPACDGSPLEAQILSWAEARTAGVGDANKTLAVLVVEDRKSLIRTLVARDYVLDEGCYNFHLRRLDQPLDAPVLPDGYVVRHLQSEREVPRRVQGHRDGWQSTLLTEESYRRMIQLPGYRMDLDIVVEAPDGTFAATCNCWLDEHNKVGIFEPASTHPEHRRKGLARALIFYGMNRLRELGATDATVCSVSHNPAATSLYNSCGMDVVGGQLVYWKRKL